VLKGSQDRCALDREAINIVKRERAYHILIIIADGQGTVATSLGPLAPSSSSR
jgi:hypothetical protein